jgi:hypothetical protein
MRSIKKTTPDQNITKSPKHKLSDMPRKEHDDVMESWLMGLK